MKICSLASGSKGNCLYLETGDAKLLIDAGLSLRETLLRLELNGINPEFIDAILVTHEHNDHIRSAGSFARKFKIPVFASHKVSSSFSKLFKKTTVNEFEAGNQIHFKDVMIDPFRITHDSCDPVGFVVVSSEGSAASVTDFGIVTRLITDKLSNCRFVNLESNHDVKMLMDGPYPWELKQRIKSRDGHISNEESLGLLHDIAHADLEVVVMAHLSEVNNNPDFVVRNVESFLNGQNVCCPKMIIGNQYHSSAVIEI